jgi:hypothetical protein
METVQTLPSTHCADRGGFVPPRRPRNETERDPPILASLLASLQDSLTGSLLASLLASLLRPQRSWGHVDLGGVLGSDPVTNPDFFTWNAVFVHYCDGASFGSGRTNPIAVHKRDGSMGQMWMRGRNNFNAVVDDLLRTQGMSQVAQP